MNNEKQDIDPRERLLDALNDPETSPEEWEELLSEEDNIQTLHLLRDCRKAFIREDASSKTDLNKAWDKFMQKRKVEMQKRYRLLSIMLITAACIILVIGILLSPSSSVDKDVFVAFKPGTGAGEVILSTNNGQRVILSSSQVDTLLERPIDLLQKNKMLDYRQEEKTKIPEIHTLQTSCSSFYQITLSDGTQVWLNAESQLIYPSLFTGEERVVELCGEGFFKVAHDSLRPFKVKVENIVTEVLGTEFNIKSYSANNTHVTLIQGCVKVRNELSKEEVTIHPQEDAHLLEDGSFEVKRVDTDNYHLWTEGYFYFDNEPLVEIMKEVGRWYNVHIVFKDNAVQNLHLHFLAQRDKPIDNVLKLLNLMGNLRVTYQNNTVYID